jgi:hypothetical protein
MDFEIVNEDVDNGIVGTSMSQIEKHAAVVQISVDHKMRYVYEGLQKTILRELRALDNTFEPEQKHVSHLLGLLWGVEDAVKELRRVP